MKSMGFVAVCSALALAAWGCSSDRGRGDDDDAGTIVLDDGGTDDGGTPADGGGGTDGGPDGGSVPMCDRFGIACMPDRGCVSGECQTALTYTLGGASDPITDHPDGEDTMVSGVYFPENYCTPNGLKLVSGGGCDPDMTGSCGECATCVTLSNTTDGPATMCLKNCEPSLTESTCPQADQDCDLSLGVCITGCGSDAECAIYRPDTNGNGEIDAYDAASNPDGDNLVYDVAGNWTCNTTTRRCEHEAPADAEAGTECTKNSDCELYGRCIDEVRYEWPGGYCLKFGCDVSGNECAGDGVCDSRAFGDPVCLQACEVGAHVDDDPFGDPVGCRPGYRCFWNGTDGAGTQNGVCVPGEYNDVTTNNIGDSCTDDSECYSPYGAARCLDWDGDEGPLDATCTLTDCAAPGIPSDVCGDNAACIDVGGTGSPFYVCIETCTDASTCEPGFGCAEITAGTTGCLWGCTADEECRTGETCEGYVPMESLGTCEAG